LIIVKTIKGNIFGGYHSGALYGPSSSYAADNTAFLFSLVNPQNNPYKIILAAIQYAIQLDQTKLIHFGDGDLNIAENSNSNNNSFCGTNGMYPNKPSPMDGGDYFQTSEIEVYNIIISSL
jgi:hypothetical protein